MKISISLFDSTTMEIFNDENVEVESFTGEALALALAKNDADDMGGDISEIKDMFKLVSWVKDCEFGAAFIIKVPGTHGNEGLMTGYAWV